MRAFMIATAFALTATTATTTLANQSKEQDCTYQAEVVAAIQQARIDRVKEANVVEAIAATNPEWPEKYNNIVPVLAGPIYDVKRRDLKNTDLGAQWKTACIGS
ncbi:hypothetical protein [Ascidiaceihabitans sp.]|uniref:hypothetical protein n=1 Tax=Ascidiaceihabitans sp. TaxID=1872644 RepID=UPI00329966EC